MITTAKTTDLFEPMIMKEFMSQCGKSARRKVLMTALSVGGVEMYKKVKEGLKHIRVIIN